MPARRNLGGGTKAPVTFRNERPKVYYVGPSGKITARYRANAGCTISEYELEEMAREQRRAEAFFARAGLHT